jgi:hypothetical protein
MPVELTIEDVAGRAGVEVAYVRRLVDLGAITPEGNDYREQDVHVAALLQVWGDAGLAPESIFAAAEAGELSLDFLESPGWELPPRLDRTYRELAEERNMPVDLLQAIHRSMGFVAPTPATWRSRTTSSSRTSLGCSSTSAGRGTRSGVSSGFTRTTSGVWRSRKPTSTLSRSNVRAEARVRASPS